ncbi:diguanylate cyclase [Myxococcota bacterium]|nr:diguanylate cyclase [Myxococcota bacterium]
MPEENPEESAHILPRLMIVDDDELIRRTFVRQFGQKSVIREASSAEEALHLFSIGFDPHIVVADYWMPGMTGIELLHHCLKVSPRTRRILVTGDGQAEILEKAVNEGHIHHFIRKPWNPGHLNELFHQMFEMIEMERRNELLVAEVKYANASLQRALEDLKRHKRLLEQDLDARTRELVDANRKLEESNARLAAQAFRDGLTGLYNHATVVSRLEEELSRAGRYRAPLSLLFCDIDHFKNYNDRLGHDNGDRVLKAVGVFLRLGSPAVSPSRKSDIVGRYGGEEFVIILPETDKKGAVVRAERLCMGLNVIDVPGATEQPLGCLSMSVGVASFPEDAQTVHDLLKCADTALYKAKEAGRNRVVQAVGCVSP